MKKIFLALISLILLCGITSCGGDGSELIPEVTILEPNKGYYCFSKSIDFSGNATEKRYIDENGKTRLKDFELTGNDLVWTSNIDGQIGIGNEKFNRYLSPGEHTITLNAKGFYENNNTSVKIIVEIDPNADICKEDEDESRDITKTIITDGYRYEGNGVNITDTFHCNGNLIIFKLLHYGESNFIVHLVNNISGEIEIYLVNKIGNFAGTVPGSPPPGDYFLEISEADGNWVIDVTGDVD